MSRKSKKFQAKLIQSILGILLILIVSIWYGIRGKAEETSTTFIETNDTKLEIFYFDVGQADSMLVMNEGKTMLIDGGNDCDGNTISNYLHSLNVDHIDYVIATHLHADHIGGLDTVVNNFDVGVVCMPEVLQTSKQVTELLTAIKNKNLQYETVQIGDSFLLGNAQCEIMHVNNEETDNLNQSSIVVNVQFGSQSFLFMGDAEKEVEESRKWNKTTILKVGHHGSNTSSSNAFLSQVKPEVAIISVGKDNSYDHPSQTVIHRLQKLGTKIYRTDEMGTIWVTSDGNHYEIKSLQNADTSLESKDF